MVEVGSLLDATRPDALIVDIEGAERDLYFASAHHLPAKLFIEIHVPRIREEASARVVERIVDLGYTMIDHRDWMFAFTRAKLCGRSGGCQTVEFIFQARTHGNDDAFYRVG